MNIESKQNGNATVVSVSGKIDAMSAPACEAFINQRIGEGALRLVLDLNGVEYISSAGLRVILASAKSLKARGGVLLLANVRGPVKEVFDISGFGAVFSIFSSVDAAVAAG